MKTFQLALIAATLALSPLTTRAQSAGPIEEMDLGACWVQRVSSSDSTPTNTDYIGYKIASFGSAVSFGLYNDQHAPEGGRLKEWVQARLKTRFPTLPAMKYSVGLHCYSAGHFISFQIERPNAQPLCINAKGVMSTGSTNNLELIAIRPDVTFDPAGSVCMGIEEKSLGISLKKTDPVEVESIRAAIAESPALKEMIDKVEYQAGSFFAVVRLKDAYAFREVEAKGVIEANAEVMAHVSNVWLNSMNTIEGQDRALFQGTTDAY
ncbi:MAG: hypothetical protein JST80_03805 [Bdellovibrionales bacterium]|nr:hypothetical protein [Bdellovibrionales bacterium]